MPELITQFSDGSLIEYDRGGFDEWCVFLTRPNITKYAPRDTEYFSKLNDFGAAFGHEKVYEDFASIYSVTTRQISKDVLDKISQISTAYGGQALDFCIHLSIVYAGMVAEENKRFTKLGKRVKRLGVHQVLIEKMPIVRAANFSRGMGWRQIDSECKKRGF